MPWVYQPNFADTLEEAKSRFKRALDSDPFPEIEGALLNYAHIAAYAREVGLIYPFRSELLKPATYPASVGTRAFFWDQKKPEETMWVTKYLDKPGDSFLLPEFSLVYVETEEIFLLPHYIAARFNLQIEFVHKGLLLGTGPLVDPGFAGKLLIPVHNYTKNEYRLSRGQGLIWVEFTKTTSLRNWTSQTDTDDARNNLNALTQPAADPHFPVEYPDNRRFLSAPYYFNIARMDRSGKETEHTFTYRNIINAFPEALERALQTSKGAVTTAQEAKRKADFLYRYAPWVASAGLFVTLAAIIFQAWSLYDSLSGQQEAFAQRVIQVQHENLPKIADSISELWRRLGQRESDIGGIVNVEDRLRRIEVDLHNLTQQLDATSPIGRPASPDEPLEPKR